jgi:predicted RNA binding protein with dsRBD fold (UPF0201 family)
MVQLINCSGVDLLQGLLSIASQMLPASRKQLVSALQGLMLQFYVGKRSAVLNQTIFVVHGDKMAELILRLINAKTQT